MKLLLLTLFTCAYLISPGGHAEVTLKGSQASQIKQNLEADKSGLVRITNTEELALFKEQGLLVKIPKTPGIKIDPRLDEQFHVVRPWTAKFLSNLGRKFRARFGQNLQINSATRTIERQEQIARNNKNAAPTEGDTRSSHLTGASIDIAKKPLSRAQKRWLRTQLKDLEHKDLIEATEERYQAVFHVMVFERYDPITVRIALK